VYLLVIVYSRKRHYRIYLLVDSVKDGVSNILFFRRES
jgi:hypothetical protein